MKRSKRVPRQVKEDLGLARSHLICSRFDDAILVYERILNHMPVDAEIWMEIAHAYAGLGKRQDAGSAYDRAKNAKSWNSVDSIKSMGTIETTCELAAAIAEQGDTELAVKLLQTLHKLEPGWNKIYAYIAEIYLMEFDGSPANGEVLWTTAQLEYKAGVPILDTLQHLSEIKRGTSDAEYWVRLGLSRIGDDALLLAQLGKVEVLKENYEEAQELFKKAVKLDPSFYLGWVELMSTNFKFGSYEAGEEFLEKVRELAKGDSKIYEVVEREVKELERNYYIMTKKTDKSKFWISRGWKMNKIGNYSEAKISFEKAIKIDSSKWRAWKGFAAALSHLSEFAMAESLLREALDIFPGSSEVWGSLAIILWDSNKITEAMEACKKALEIDPESEQIKLIMESLERKMK